MLLQRNTLWNSYVSLREASSKQEIGSYCAELTYRFNDLALRRIRGPEGL